MIRQTLENIARDRNYTTYGTIAPLLALDMANPDHRKQMSDILCAVSEVEHAGGRPLLSAVVIREDKNMPGEGFFTLARELGVQRPSEDDLVFWCRELSHVHEFWSNH